MEKIIIAGDFVPQDRVLTLINEGNYSTTFNQVKSYVAQADYAIVNLEAPLVDGVLTPIKKNGPNLYAPICTMDAINYIGFNCVTLANNHFYDQGEKGAKTTIEECLKHDIDIVGAGMNLKAASLTLYKYINGICYAFINCCEHEYSIATEINAGSNPINPIQQYYAIQEAKKKSDHVIVICHGGIELFPYPTPRMVEWYRFFIDAGADAIVNHHQHCFSGYEVYKGKLIFYGLGNFCFDRSDKRNSTWNEGYFVELLFGDEMKFNVITYSQCNSTPTIEVLLDDNDMKSKLYSINESILDDTYKIYYSDFISKNSRYDWVFTPYTNNLLKLLFHHNLLPHILGSKNWGELSDLTLCESHNERFRYFLAQKTN